jgi:hypothetical protein
MCNIKWQNQIFKMHTQLLLAGMKVQRDKGARITLLGGNIGGRAVTLRLIRFQSVGFWISTGLPCIYIYSWPHVYPISTCTKFDLHRILQNNYCGSSLFWDVTQCWLVVTDVSRLLYPWRWDWQAVPKHRYLTTNQRCVTSQKSKDLVYTVVEAWNHA